MALSVQAWRNAATSGPSTEHMIAGLVSMERPCSAYSGNTTRSMVGMLRRALLTMATMVSVCLARSVGVATVGSCSWTRPMTTPLGDLLRPPNPFMGSSSIRSPDGGAQRRNPGLDSRIAPRFRGAPCGLRSHQRQLPRHAAQRAAGRDGKDHHDESEHIGD